jgi:dTMP kinase
MELIFAIEGIDQSGKGMQTKMLVERLRTQGHKVELISFPDYFTIIGKEIKAFLEGYRNYSSQVRHMLLSLNRWERKDLIDEWLKEGKTVVLDRYSGSNYAYGLTQGLELDWLLNLEKGLPEPSITILLDLSPEMSLNRKMSGRDIHERDQELLKGVRKEYLKLAKRWCWIIVDASSDPDTVHNRIWSKLDNFIQKSHH